jgi:hypothetical protein
VISPLLILTTNHFFPFSLDRLGKPYFVDLNGPLSSSRFPVLEKKKLFLLNKSTPFGIKDKLAIATTAPQIDNSR